MTLEEFDRLNRQGKAHACPICGKQYLSHCYHNGEEVNCIVMDVPKARKLVEGTIHGLKNELAEFEKQLKEYQEIEKRIV